MLCWLPGVAAPCVSQAWATLIKASAGCALHKLLAGAVQDCNLVEYDATLGTKGPSQAGAVFSTGTSGKSAMGVLDAGCQLFVISNSGSGSLYLQDGKSNVLFTTAGVANPVADTLYPGAPLHQGYRLYSANGLYYLTLQVCPQVIRC